MKVTVSVTSQGGFNYDIEFEATNFTELKDKESKLIASGFTPKKSFGGYKKKEIEYVSGIKCPQCGSQIVKGKNKKGDEFYKCEFNTFKDPKCNYFKYLEKGPSRV